MKNTRLPFLSYSDDIIVTTGATQGLHLILSTLIDFAGVIFVDEVTYMIALSAMSQFTTMKVVTGTAVMGILKRIKFTFDVLRSS